MGDEKKYTERDLVMAKRVAYYKALMGFTYDSNAEARAKADLAFPMPKKVVPRVVKVPTGTSEFKWETDTLWIRQGGTGCWVEWLGPEVSAVIRDLILHPTEEVEDD